MTGMSKDSESVRETLWSLIKDMKTAMLTTADNGILRSRPMHGHQDAFNGTLWFLTKASSHKTLEIERQCQVNVSYTDLGKERYVSVSGAAELVKERIKIKELWNPFADAWFPEGPDDPSVELIKVTAEDAEYWDGPSSKAVQLWKLTKAKISGEEPELGDHEKVRLSK